MRKSGKPNKFLKKRKSLIAKLCLVSMLCVTLSSDIEALAENADHACYEQEDINRAEDGHSEEEKIPDCEEDNESKDDKGLDVVEPEHENDESEEEDTEPIIETDKWEEAAKKVVLTGNSVEDVLAIANSQFGYQENVDDFEIDLDGEIRGRSRYGERYGMPYAKWDSLFIRYCFEMANAKIQMADFDCQRWLLNLETAGLYHTVKDTYIPQRGDLVFFDSTGDGAADCMGLLQSLDGKKIYTIEGDRENAVCCWNYDTSDPCIIGYGASTFDIGVDESEKKEKFVTLTAQSESGALLNVLCREHENGEFEKVQLVFADYRDGAVAQRVRSLVESPKGTFRVTRVFGVKFLDGEIQKDDIGEVFASLKGIESNAADIKAFSVDSFGEIVFIDSNCTGESVDFNIDGLNIFGVTYLIEDDFVREGSSGAGIAKIENNYEEFDYAIKTKVKDLEDVRNIDATVGETFEFYSSQSTLPKTFPISKDDFSYVMSYGLDKELTFNEDVAVLVGGEPFRDFSVNYTPRYEEDGSQTVNVDLSNLYKYRELAGRDVRVGFTVTLNDSALSSGRNSACITSNSFWKMYSSELECGDNQANLYWAILRVIKVAAHNESKLLSGAKFRFTSLEKGKGNPFVFDYEGKWNEGRTNEDGIIKAAIGDGTFEITELEAPGGYSLLDKSINCSVDFRMVDGEPVFRLFKEGVEIHGENNEFAFNIANEASPTGVKLPETGGKGNMYFLLCGLIVVLLAVVNMIANRRMKGDFLMKLKRLGALLMALATAATMSLSMASTALAKESTIRSTDGTITLKGVRENCQYDLYKIFDASYNTENKDEVSYKVSALWADFFNGNGAKYLTEEKGKDMRAVEFGSKVMYAKIDDKNVREFSEEALKYALEDSGRIYKSVKHTGKENNLTIDVKDLGYYMIYPKGDAVAGWMPVCSLVTTAPDAEVDIKGTSAQVTKRIVAKNGVDLISENFTDVPVAVGDTLTYEIKATVPGNGVVDMYKDAVLVDTMQKGLFFDGPAGGDKVWVDGYYREFATAVREVQDRRSEYGCMTILLPLRVNETRGKEITYKYSVVVTPDIIDAKNKAAANKAKMVFGDRNEILKKEYKFDEDVKLASGVKTPEAKVTAYCSSVVINKVDSEFAKLSGAKFSIKGGTTKIRMVNKSMYVPAGEHGKYWRLKDGTYTWYDPCTKLVDINSYEDLVETYNRIDSLNWDNKDKVFVNEGWVDKDGRLTFDGLDEGKYEITELVAPEGYTKLPKSMILEIKFDEKNHVFTAILNGEKHEVDATSDINIQVVNKGGGHFFPGKMLPKTGGIGTTLFYLIGGAFVLAAAVLMFALKRKEDR